MTRSKIRTSGAEGLTLSSTDITIASGDLLFGTSAKGVNLGVTSNTDSNTLDDYEEGTWTPQYGTTGTSPTITYHTQVGRYIKIGRLVHCQGRIRTDGVNASGASGSIRLKNLPFTTNSDSNSFSAINIAFSNNWGGDRHPHAGYVEVNQTAVRLICFDTSDPRDGFVINPDQGDFDTSSGGNNDLLFSIQYRID